VADQSLGLRDLMLVGIGAVIPLVTEFLKTSISRSREKSRLRRALYVDISYNHHTLRLLSDPRAQPGHNPRDLQERIKVDSYHVAKNNHILFTELRDYTEIDAHFMSFDRFRRSEFGDDHERADKARIILDDLV
jgi:hypothetical protein